MLQNLREHAQGWIAGIIAALLALAFALWGIQYYLNDQGKDKIAAKVNGTKITDELLATTYARIKRERMLQEGKPTSFSEAEQLALKNQALNELVYKTVLVQNAKAKGYYIGFNQISNAITQVPAFQVKGNFSKERFSQMLTAMMYTPESFYQELGDTLLVSQAQEGITNSAFVLSKETKNLAVLLNQRRDFQYVVIPHARFLEKINPAQEEIKQFYEQHSDEFKLPEKVSIAYLILSADKIKKQLIVTDQKLKMFYQNNIENYSTPQQWQTEEINVKLVDSSDKKLVDQSRNKINKIYSEIKAGKQFSDLEKKYANDSTVTIGKPSKWFDSKQRSPIFIQIISNLKPGEVSAPYQDVAEFKLVKLVDSRPQQIKPFSEVRAQVEKAYRQQVFEQAFATASDKLNELTYTNPNSLEPAAKALNLPISETGLFSRDGLPTGYAHNPKVLNAAFSDEVLQQGNNSDLIQLDENTVIVLRVKQHKLSSLRPINEVKPQIVKELKKQRSVKLTKKLGEEIISALGSNIKSSSLNKVSTHYQLSWHIEKNVLRQQAGVNGNILQAAFNLPAPGARGYSAKGLQLKNGDYAIVVVTKLSSKPLKQISNQELKVLSNGLVISFGQLDYELYVKSLMDKSKIKVFEK